MRTEMKIMELLKEKGWSPTLSRTVKAAIALWHEGKGDYPAPGYIEAIWTQKPEHLDKIDRVPLVGELLMAMGLTDLISTDPTKDRSDQEFIKKQVR